MTDTKEQKQAQNGKARLIRLSFDDLNGRYEQKTAVVRVEAIFSTECVGGQPADEEGIREFVKHHLEVTDPVEIEQAVRRILDEELEDATPVEGEVKESKVYGVRALRRDSCGVWLGDWMVKACAKVAFSRLQIFTKIRGSKGDVAEVGRVRGWKYSLANPQKPWQIYCVGEERTDVAAGQNPDDAWIPKQPETYHKDFMGRVQSPNGPVSIIHKSECIAPGTRFAFEFRFLQHNLTSDDLADVLAFMMTVGLGSARSLERGKFQIVNAEIEMEEPKPPAEKKPKDKKKGKNEGEDEQQPAGNGDAKPGKALAAAAGK